MYQLRPCIFEYEVGESWKTYGPPKFCGHGPLCYCMTPTLRFMRLLTNLEVLLFVRLPHVCRRPVLLLSLLTSNLPDGAAESRQSALSCPIDDNDQSQFVVL